MLLIDRIDNRSVSLIMLTEEEEDCNFCWWLFSSLRRPSFYPILIHLISQPRTEQNRVEWKVRIVNSAAEAVLSEMLVIHVN